MSLIPLQTPARPDLLQRTSLSVPRWTSQEQLQFPLGLFVQLTRCSSRTIIIGPFWLDSLMLMHPIQYVDLSCHYWVFADRFTLPGFVRPF